MKTTLRNLTYVAAFAMIFSTAHAAITDGLIAHYEFEGTSGAVIDSAGSFNGTNNGATRGVPGKIGNAFQFSGGISTFVDTLPAGAIPATSTVSLWMNPTHNIVREGGQIFGSISGIQEGAHGLSVGYSEVISAVDAYYYHALGSVFSSQNSFPLDTWTHMTYTYDAAANDVNIYANGSLVGSGSFDTSLSTHEESLMFGASIRAQAHSHGLNGKMDDVKIWDRALSAAEVASLVPEPSTLALIVLGMAGITWRRRRA